MMQDRITANLVSPAAARVGAAFACARLVADARGAGFAHSAGLAYSAGFADGALGAIRAFS